MDRLMSVDGVKEYMNRREVKIALYVAKYRVGELLPIKDFVKELNDNGIAIKEEDYGIIEVGSGIDDVGDSKVEDIYQYVIRKELSKVCTELEDEVNELSKKVDELNDEDKEKDEYGLFKYLNELKPKKVEEFKENVENSEYKTHKVVEHLQLLVEQIKMFTDFIDKDSVEIGLNVKMDAYKDAKSIVMFHSKVKGEGKK